MRSKPQTQAERRDRTRGKLLKAARTVFGRRGYERASIDEIAAKAGLSKGAVYYHFKSKDDLFLALLDERAAEQIRSIRELFASPTRGSTDTGARIQTAAREAVQTFRQGREWRILFLEFVVHAARNPEFREEAAWRFDRMRSAIAEAVSSQAGALDANLPLEPDEIGIAINAMGNGLAVEMLMTPDAIPEELFGQLLTYLFAGMAAAVESPAGGR